MGSWLDRWARHAAAPSEAPARPASAHPTRRDVLKQAGVVGGLVWTVPVIQTALAPAASASGVGIGQPCSPDGDPCSDGSICFTGVCGAKGAPCGADAQCASLTCRNGKCKN